MKTLHYPAFGKRCAMKIENGKIVEATGIACMSSAR